MKFTLKQWQQYDVYYHENKIGLISCYKTSWYATAIDSALNHYGLGSYSTKKQALNAIKMFHGDSLP